MPDPSSASVPIPGSERRPMGRANFLGPADPEERIRVSVRLLL